MLAIAMKDLAGSSEDTAVVLADLRVVLGLVVLATGVANADVEGKGLDPRWTRALDHAREALAARDDVDRSIAIVVTPATPGVRVTARRATGEQAERDVDAVDDLAPSILALVVVPPPAAQVRVEPAFDAELPGDPVLARVAEPAAPLGLDLGMTLAMRWQGVSGVGAGAFAALARGAWLVDATAAWTTGSFDDAGAGAARVSLTTLELGLDAGRRFTLGPFALDGHVGPRLVRATSSLQDTAVPEIPVQYIVPSIASLQLAAGVRARWATPARVHVFVGIDASLGQTHHDAQHVIMENGSSATMIEVPQRTFGIGLVLGTDFEVLR